MVATCDPRQETAASLARMMVGAEIGEVKAAAGEPRRRRRALVVHKLSLEPDDPHGTRLKDISLDVRGGEIVGIAGVAGNGQDELFAALSGERLRAERGAVVIDGKAAGRLGVTERRRLGAAFVPEERLGHGAAPRMNLAENALLTGHAASGMVKRGFIDKRGDARASSIASSRPSTCARPSAIRKPSSLSGGNLQKFIVGREILREPSVLVVSQPTWGVDAGAAADHPPGADRSAGRGAAVLVISQDLDELFEISDRIAVMFHGELSAPLAAAEATREKTRPADGRRRPPTRPTAGREARMQLVLERRAERSAMIASLSPLIAIALTLVTGAILFAFLGKNPLDGALGLLHRAADRPVLAAGARRQGDAAGPDRGRPVALLPRQHLEHRRRGPVHRRRALRSWLAVRTNGTDVGPWVLPADAAARRARRRALRR